MQRKAQTLYTLGQPVADLLAVTPEAGADGAGIEQVGFHLRVFGIDATRAGNFLVVLLNLLANGFSTGRWS